MDTNKKSANLSRKRGKQIDARAKYDKQIIVLPTIRFRSPPARRGIINQTESHAARIAILPTRTMDADLHPRSDSYLLMGQSPQWRPFGHMTREQSAVLRFPAEHFGILLILTAPGEQPRTLPMRTVFLFHHRLSPTRPRPVITHPQQTKTTQYEIVKSQNRVSNFVVP